MEDAAPPRPKGRGFRREIMMKYSKDVNSHRDWLKSMVEARQQELAEAEERLSKFENFTRTLVEDKKDVVAKPKAKKAQSQRVPERLPVREAIGIIMGKKSMTITQIMDSLAARNWTPVSRNPRQYVSVTLSTYKNLFEKVGQGVYKLQTGVSFRTHWARLNSLT